MITIIPVLPNLQVAAHYAHQTSHIASHRHPASPSAIPCLRQAVVRAVVSARHSYQRTSEDRPLPNEPPSIMPSTVHLGFTPSIMPSPPSTQFAAFAFGRDPAAVTCMRVRGKLPCPPSNHQPRHLSSHSARATCKQGRRHHNLQSTAPSPHHASTGASHLSRAFPRIAAC
jgi:hypothetical protein